MTTPTMNPIATIKEIGAIEHRIHDATLHPNIKAACIRRSLDNLIDTTAPGRKFHGIIGKCRVALDNGDTLDMLAGLALLRSMIPVTWGMVTAGTAVRIPNAGVYIKRKQGAEEIHTSALFKHFDPAQIVEDEGRDLDRLRVLAGGDQHVPAGGRMSERRDDLAEAAAVRR